MTDIFFSVVLPWCVVLGICALMLTVAGCSTTDGGSRSLDLAVRGSYIPGPGASTRNQNPQGGPDEKSESTPTESVR